MKIFGVTGWRNTGKTGLMERLVAEMTGGGLRVSTIKHAHHAFDVDRPGKDSYRHRAAGANQVLLVSRFRWVLMDELRDAPEPPLDELLTRMNPVDLVLIEGYKRDRHSKVETHRADAGRPLIAPDDPTVRAVASDTPEVIRSQVGDRPVMHLDDTAAIAAFIRRECELT